LNTRESKITKIRDDIICATQEDSNADNDDAARAVSPDEASGDEDGNGGGDDDDDDDDGNAENDDEEKKEGAMNEYIGLYHSEEERNKKAAELQKIKKVDDPHPATRAVFKNYCKSLLTVAKLIKDSPTRQRRRS